MPKFGEYAPIVESGDKIVRDMIFDYDILCTIVDELLSVYIEVGQPNPKDKQSFIDEVFKKLAAKKETYQDEELRSLIAIALERESSKIKTNKQVQPNNDGMPLPDESDTTLPDTGQLSMAEMREADRVNSKPVAQGDNVNVRHAVSKATMKEAWHHEKSLGGDHEDEK